MKNRMKFSRMRMVVLICATMCCGNGWTASGAELTVVYTANSFGKLRACNCPNDPYGGLAERVTMMKELRKKESPFLLVDSGGMMSLFGQYDLRARTVMRLMNLMGYNAAGTGCYEFARGVESAYSMGETAEFPLLSTTIAAEADSVPVFKSWVVKTVGSCTAGIISVCDSTCLIPIGSPRPKGYFFLPAEDTVRRALEEISPRCDFIIMLSSLSSTLNERMADMFPSLDLIVESNGSHIIDPPEAVPHGIIVSPGDRGKFVGLITLVKNGDGTVSLKRHELFPVLQYSEDRKAHTIVMEFYDNVE